MSCHQYFDAQQVGLLGQLIDAFSAWILYLLGLHPVLKNILAPNLFSRSLPRRGTGHSGIYKEYIYNNRVVLEFRLNTIL